MNERVNKIKKYAQICDRAKELGFIVDRVSLLMDIESADLKFNLRLDDMLNGDDLNFAHDISGIVNNINRTKFPATDFGYFVPRYTENN